MSLSYSNNVIKSDCVKIKGKISLSSLMPKETTEIVEENTVDITEEKRLELLKLEEEITQKLADAQAKYDEIIDLANIESEKILTESREKSLDIEKKAYNEGYEQGTKNGYEDGYKEAYEDNIEKAKQESAQIIEKANSVMLEANSQIASYLKENKKNILAIGISIAEKVLRQKFEDEEAMDSLVLDVIKEYELKENFVIRVNSIYKESLDKQIIELKESKHIEKDVFILADETIEKGNALIESVNGRLIIGIDDVLTKVKEELL